MSSVQMIDEIVVCSLSLDDKISEISEERDISAKTNSHGIILKSHNNKTLVDQESFRPSTPEIIRSVKRELSSPDTPFKGGSRKVILYINYKQKSNLARLI
jgi:hypothetical protein